MFIESDPGRWILLDRVDSTSTYLQANPSLPSGTVVLAREQFAGRGTGGRSWVTLADHSFIFSAALADARILPERLVFLPLLVGLAVLEAAGLALRAWPVETEAPRIGIKWPNDILLMRAGQRGKLAGVLVESEVNRGGYRAIIGVGLNWLPIPEALFTPPPVEPVACLFPGDPGAKPFDFTALLVARLNAHLVDLTRPGPPALLTEVRRHCWLTGRRVLIDGAARKVFGIGDSGALLVDAAPGGPAVEVFGRPEPIAVLAEEEQA